VEFIPERVSRPFAAVAGSRAALRDLEGAGIFRPVDHGAVIERCCLHRAADRVDPGSRSLCEGDEVRHRLRGFGVLQVDDHRAAACLKVGKQCRVGCSGEKNKVIPFHAHVSTMNSTSAQDH
jgi:hypothetical protein